jgi:predicted methyltransferase
MKPRLTDHVHASLKACLRPGDWAVDATAGNGYDTLLLAELVGLSGQVYSIDVQAAAIDATRKRLKETDCLAQVDLRQNDHATALETLVMETPKGVRAIVFNLGFLPGSDKAVQTQPENTLRALEAGVQLLAADGIMAVTAYRGHPGGQIEADAVAAWMLAQEKAGWSVVCHDPEARRENPPPVLWLITPPTKPA